jgi:hypothetical protein
MMEAQIVGGLGHQGIERRIAGEMLKIGAIVRFSVRTIRTAGAFRAASPQAALDAKTGIGVDGLSTK